ncbi:MAG: hypothetical protein JXX28_17965 [Deltaproteobacteria bacterium]|nr:hypothetical protein [Deltaproteobacteria bacterium]
MLALILLLACSQPADPAPPEAGAAATAAATASAPTSHHPAFQAIMVRHTHQGSDPEVVLHLWLEAIYLMESDDPALRDAGEQALVALSLPLREDKEWRHRHSNVLFLDRIANQQHIFRSYAAGTSPEDGYAVDPAQFQIEITRRDEAEPGAPLRLYIRSSGADSPRPVSLKRSTTTGRYYLWEWSSLYVGVRKPHLPGEERFE